MGTFSTLLRQCAAFVLATGVLAWAAPAEARPWVAVTGAVMLAAFLGITLHRHRQIRRLAAEVDEVLHGGRTVGFSNCREGDVAVLSNELAKMVARLVRARDQLAAERSALADALADVSHQIRTPLTAAALMLPAVERADDAVERKRVARELEAMIERVSWLVTSLLKIAKADAGAMRMERHEVRAADVARRAVAPLAMAMDLHDVGLAMDLDEEAAFRGDAHWTTEAEENNAKNCMEHTPAGGTVAVSVRENALACTIAVSDTGAGIAPEDLPFIFERFHRGGAGNDVRQAAGFGIGLSLAQALVSAQGGTVRAANNDVGGARFEVVFPKVVV